MQSYIEELQTNGFTVIPDILNNEEIVTAKNLFLNWKNNLHNHDKIHNLCDPHGIYKYQEVGHREHGI